MLPIDDVNLIVLRQMLKLRIFSAPDEAGRRRFYAPAVMALLLLLQNRAMDRRDLSHRRPGAEPLSRP